MKLIVAGQDRTAELGAALRAVAVARPAGLKPAVLPESISALRLRDAANEAEYLDELVRLLRYRDNVDTLPFDIPRSPGPLGAVLVRCKAALWNLLRYQHDRITFRQNLVSHLHSSALEFQQREIQELRRRLAALKSKPR